MKLSKDLLARTKEETTQSYSYLANINKGRRLSVAVTANEIKAVITGAPPLKRIRLDSPKPTESKTTARKTLSKPGESKTVKTTKDSSEKKPVKSMTRASLSKVAPRVDSYRVPPKTSEKKPVGRTTSHQTNGSVKEPAGDSELSYSPLRRSASMRISRSMPPPHRQSPKRAGSPTEHLSNRLSKQSGRDEVTRKPPARRASSRLEELAKPRRPGVRKAELPKTEPQKSDQHKEVLYIAQVF